MSDADDLELETSKSEQSVDGESAVDEQELQGQQADGNLSALRENISRKGKNSYYYAHSHKVNGPEWDGKEEPRKLSDVPAAPGSAAGDVLLSKPLPLALDTITEYSWADEKNNVKIYIESDNLDNVNDNDISLTSTSTSLDFRYKANDKEHSLSIAALHDSIESASYKKKSAKFILSLKKSSDVSWSSLKRI